MVSELRNAIERVEVLPDADQKRIADLIVEALSADQTLKISQLYKLAGEALEEYKKRETIQVDL